MLVVVNTLGRRYGFRQMPRFHQDGEIANQIVELVRDARKQVTLVSPYLDLWRHLQDELRDAVKRGVVVSVITRDENEITGGKAVRWLRNNDFEVVAVEGLHAKAYLNEFRVLVGSMNLTEFSTKNSYEVAFDLDIPEQKHVRDYVKTRLLGRGRVLAKPKARDQLVQGVRKLTQEVAAVAANTLANGTGHCIRCGGVIELNPERPLCLNCYPQWAQYANQDYREKKCHRCGKPRAVTYRRPQCRPCFSVNQPR